jgi:hypothetical protein
MVEKKLVDSQGGLMLSDVFFTACQPLSESFHYTINTKEIAQAFALKR